MDNSAPQIQNGVEVNPEINFFGATNYRNQNRKFGIKIDDRRRHMYVVGKTGMGKTTVLENMVLNDIYAGHGIGLVDPHGDFAEKIINFIPNNRVNDVVYFNPSDIDYPIGFNILESVNPEYRHLVASGLMGVFKKIWPDVWSARMEYILNNTILALLDFPGTTLLGINRLLADDAYRKKVVGVLKDPVVKAFWENEFEKYDERFRREAIAPIQNKIGQFLSASVIRNIVAQVKSRINIREIMDTKKIFIMNLSKGRIGEDNSRLLGGMIITKIQLSAMERVDTPEKDRKDFFLYVDEFQNFATESFANILSEARKYRLDLTMAHQYMAQLDETVLAAVIGNVGSMLAFRVGSSDAEILAKEFIPTFVEEDLVNLPKFHIYLKLMIDGVASRPFSALTLPPIGSATGSLDKVVRASRERYAMPRDKIEEKVARWSGMAGGDLGGDEMDDDFVESSVVATPAAKTSAPSPVSTKPTFSSASTSTPKKYEQPRPQFSKPSGGSSSYSSSPASQSVRNNSSYNNSNSTGENAKRKRKRTRGSGSVPREGATETVSLVDTAQKGISLNQMMYKSSPVQPVVRAQPNPQGNTPSIPQSRSSTVPSPHTTSTQPSKPVVPQNVNPTSVPKPSLTPNPPSPAPLPKPAVSPAPVSPPKVIPPAAQQTRSPKTPEKLPPPTAPTPTPQVIKPGQIIKFD